MAGEAAEFEITELCDVSVTVCPVHTTMESGLVCELLVELGPQKSDKVL